MFDIKPRFGSNLKNARINAGYTQIQLAEICGTTQSAISSFEKGLSAPNLEIAAQMACLLGVSLDCLCGLDEKGITAYQWLQFTCDLVAKPPEIDHNPVLQLDLNDNNGAAIVFNGNEMVKLFETFKALDTIKEIDADAYAAAKKSLLEKYSKFIEPGFKQYKVGAPSFPG